MSGTYLKVGEVAEMLGISRSAVYDLAAPKGPIPCLRLGPRCIRINREDVQTYIEKCRPRQDALQTVGKVSITNVKIAVFDPMNCVERLGLKVKP